MSFDSLRMLQEARTSVIGGPYPVAPVYILRLFDIGGHGSTAMLEAQNFLLLLSMMLILRTLKVGLILSTISLLAILVFPTVIGCMLVLWKDVSFAALIMLSISLIFYTSQRKCNDSLTRILKWASLLFLFIATLVRLNAITSTGIVVFYWLYVFCMDRSLKLRCGMFFAIIAFMFAGNNLINTRGFPDLHKLAANPIFDAIMINDIIGISNWSRDSLLPLDANNELPSPKMPIAYIDKIYSSMGVLAIADNINKYQDGNIRIFPPNYNSNDLTQAWLSAIYKHPIAYLQYRCDLFQEIVGAKNHETFEPTHFGGIDENSYGLKIDSSRVTTCVLQYIKFASNSFWGKPWFFYILSILSTFLLYKNESIRPQLKIFSYYSLAAAALYILPFYFITGTGEVRYNFPSLILCSSCIFVWIYHRKNNDFLSSKMDGIKQ
jgi:hypothetical protein